MSLAKSLSQNAGVLSTNAKTVNFQSWHSIRERELRPPIGRAPPHKRHGLVLQDGTSKSKIQRGSPTSCAGADILATSWLSPSSTSPTSASMKASPKRSLAVGLTEEAWAQSVLNRTPSKRQMACEILFSAPQLDRASSSPKLSALPSNPQPALNHTRSASKDGLQLSRRGSKASIGRRPSIDPGTGSADDFLIDSLSLLNSRLLSKQSSPGSRMGSKSKHGFDVGSEGLAQLARKWSLPLNTVKESSALFSQYASRPDHSEEGDILQDGALHENEMILLVLKLTETNDLGELSSEARRVMSIADVNMDGLVDFKEFAIWYHNREFLEYVNLSQAEIMIRAIGQRLGINVSDMEDYKALFDKFDTDSSGFIDYTEFKGLLHILMKCPKDLGISESRCMYFWTQCDWDKSGSVDLEEFIKFYTTNFDADSEDPLQDYYRSIRRVSISTDH